MLVPTVLVTNVVNEASEVFPIWLRAHLEADLAVDRRTAPEVLVRDHEERSRSRHDAPPVTGWKSAQAIARTGCLQGLRDSDSHSMTRARARRCFLVCLRNQTGSMGSAPLRWT